MDIATTASNSIGDLITLVDESTTGPKTIWTIDYVSETEYYAALNQGTLLYIVHKESGLVAGVKSNGRGNNDVIQLQT